MKQKKIIERLIQQSKYEQREEPFEQDYQPQSKIINQSIDTIKVHYEFQVFIDIGDGRSDSIYINQSSDPFKQAILFCDKHSLQPYISKLLGDSLQQQIQNQKKLAQENQDNAENIIDTQKMRQSKETKPHSYKRCKSRQLWPKQQYEYKPKINQISSEIIRKVGKKSIIQSVCRKSHQKIQQMIFEQLQNSQKQYKQYSFHPNINPISEKVDQTLCMNKSQFRYEQLYKNHKRIEDKKEQMRKSSMMDISFKPQINQLSKKIMSKKKSLGTLRSYSGSKEKLNSINKLNQSLCVKNANIPKTGRKPLSRNQGNIPIGDYLYQEGLRTKVKQEKVKKQNEKSISKENWKIINSSDNLANQKRQMKIRQIFYNLTQPPHKFLYYRDIENKRLTEVQKIFEPVYKQLKQIDTDLSEEEFVQACYRLLKYLSPAQKSILVKKIEKEKENKKISAINKKSQEIVKQKEYSAHSIYVRGVLYKKQAKEQLEKRKQDKVRKQLRNCTFKPKINGDLQNF